MQTIELKETLVWEYFSEHYFYGAILLNIAVSLFVCIFPTRKIYPIVS